MDEEILIRNSYNHTRNIFVPENVVNKQDVLVTLTICFPESEAPRKMSSQLVMNKIVRAPSESSKREVMRR